MDHIDAAFTKSIRSTRNVNPAIRAAIVTAKKTLNRYYSRTDDVDVYRIAMSKFSIYFCLIILLDSYFRQYYIPHTNWSILNQLNGSRIGLKLQKNFYGLNLNGIMRRFQ
jgi:hypothetical protein